MFEWLCRKRINGLIALNKFLNAELQKASDKIDELEVTLEDEEAAHAETCAIISFVKGKISELEALLEEEEADSRCTNSFIDAIDNTISDALRDVGRFPDKPAGLPDRVDVIAATIKEFHAEIERLMRMLADPKILELEVEKGAVNITFEEHWAIKYLARSFSDSLGDAKNWAAVEVGPMPTAKGSLMVTIQRKDGTTPAETIRDQDAVIAELEDGIEKLEATAYRRGSRIADLECVVRDLMMVAETHAPGCLALDDAKTVLNITKKD